jgi:ABC-2 type transport system ATP-binding protein
VSAIAVDRVSRRFGDVAAVDHLSFTVRRGEIVALLGPNGAGKTTTTEMLEGFLAPSAGTVSVLGVDPRAADGAWRARIGLVMQSTSLDAQLTVREELDAFARVFPRSRPVDEVLRLIDLDGAAATRIGRLSGGQQRRVDLGLGIVGRPEVLFLDEPTTGLDPAARRRIWDVIAELARGGTTVLLTTHYLEEAEALADRLLVLAHGRLVADATPDELRAAAETTIVRFPLQEDVRLPDELAAFVDAERHEVVAPTRHPERLLRTLLDWACAEGVGLTGLEVGPPSLETAYLALTDEPAAAHA